MKKLLSIFLFCLLVGCTNNNTPKEEVEALFYKFNSLDTEVISQLDNAINNTNMNDTHKKRYKDIFIKQYKNLKHNIKEENIINTNAIVITEIEVYDLNYVRKNLDMYLDEDPDIFDDSQGVFNDDDYWDYKLTKMESTTKRVKYILELSLTRIDGIWILDNLIDSERKKIHGLYN